MNGFIDFSVSKLLLINSGMNRFDFIGISKVIVRNLIQNNKEKN